MRSLPGHFEMNNIIIHIYCGTELFLNNGASSKRVSNKIIFATSSVCMNTMSVCLPIYFHLDTFCLFFFCCEWKVDVEMNCSTILDERVKRITSLTLKATFSVRCQCFGRQKGLLKKIGARTRIIFRTNYDNYILHFSLFLSLSDAVEMWNNKMILPAHVRQQFLRPGGSGTFALFSVIRVCGYF